MPRISVALVLCIALFAVSTLGGDKPLSVLAVDEIDACLTKEELIKLMPTGEVKSDSCFIPFGRSTCAPQFIIPGSMKCGTTSLYTYLQDHPQVLPLASPQESHTKAALADKEIRFLDNLPTKARQFSSLHATYNAYYSYFKPMVYDDNFQLFSGDATPMYVSKPNVAKRAYYANPTAKVIAMVREPVDRMWSETWFLNSLKGNISPSSYATIANTFEHCIRAELYRMKRCVPIFSSGLTVENGINYVNCVNNITIASGKNRCESEEFTGMCAPVTCKSSGTAKNSFYAAQLIEWKEFFGDNLMVINSNDFYENTEYYMEIIADFIGLNPYDWGPVTSHAFNIVNPKKNHIDSITSSPGLGIGVSDSGNSYPELSERVRKEFEEVFAPLNDLLYEVLDVSPLWEYY